MAAAKTDNLVAALIAATNDMPDLIKDSKNPHFSSSFASLPNVIETVTPSLHKHGLVVFQTGDVDENGRAFMRTTLRHTSGEEICSTLPLRAANETNPQQIGSSITYMRRYGLLGILNLAAEDDDGNMAAGQKPAVKPPSEPQMKLLKSLMASVRSAKSKTAADEVSKELSGKAINDISGADATKMIDKLKEEQEKAKSQDNARRGAF